MITSYNFGMIVVNFICVMVLYLIIMYLFSKYMDMEEKINDLIEYQEMNDRQLKNLVKDINYNDTHLTKYINLVMSKQNE